MPNRDATGPDGVGPTGLGKGSCVRTSSQNVRPYGRRYMGMGRCMCPYILQEGIDDALLEEEENFLQERLEVVRKAREDLQKEK